MFENTWKLYEIIDKLPNRAPLTYALMLQWSVKKVNRKIKRLLKDRMIVKCEKKDRYRGKTIKEFINIDDLKNE